MKTRKTTMKGTLGAKLARIERKCDLILSQLLILRQRRGMDEAIDTLNRAACSLRDKARSQYDNSLGLLR